MVKCTKKVAKLWEGHVQSQLGEKTVRGEWNMVGWGEETEGKTVRRIDVGRGMAYGSRVGAKRV